MLSNSSTYPHILERESTYCLRGICMILIIIDHIWQHAFNDNECLGVLMYAFGFLGTGLFLFLSGYGLYLSLSKHDTISVQYCLSHMLKLLKPFLFGYLVFMIYDLIVGNFDAIYYFKCLFTLTMPTTLSWFYKVITVTYLVTFLVFRLLKTMRNRVITICTLCLIYFIIANIFLMSDWYMSILNFPLGILFAINKDKLSKTSKNVSYCLLIIFLIAFFATRISSHLWFIPNLIFSLFCVYILTTVQLRSTLLHFVGVNSLCFYLYEMHPLYWLDQIDINPWFYSIGVLMITTMLTIVYLLIDKNILSLWNKDTTQTNVTSK